MPDSEQAQDDAQRPAHRCGAGTGLDVVDIEWTAVAADSSQGQGFMVFGFLASRVSQRWSVWGALATVLVTVVGGSVGVLATATGHLQLVVMVCSLFTLERGRSDQ